MMIPIYSNFNHYRSLMFISHMRAIKEINMNMKMLNDMLDTYMVWIENDTIDIIFIFISITIWNYMYFQSKTNSIGIA